MQYTAEGSDLLGAFTRATFCTVVSRSPEDREVVIPRRPTPQADSQDSLSKAGPGAPAYMSANISESLAQHVNMSRLVYRTRKQT